MGMLKSAAIRGFLLLSLGLLIVGFLLAGTRNDAKEVLKVSDGVIASEELGAVGMKLLVWETQVSIVEDERDCIYQTSVRNRDFIVKCRGKYYVNWSIIDAARKQQE